MATIKEIIEFIKKSRNDENRDLLNELLLYIDDAKLTPEQIAAYCNATKELRFISEFVDR